MDNGRRQRAQAVSPSASLVRRGALAVLGTGNDWYGMAARPLAPAIRS